MAVFCNQKYNSDGKSLTGVGFKDVIFVLEDVDASSDMVR
jgi:hypothetical protein